MVVHIRLLVDKAVLWFFYGDDIHIRLYALASNLCPHKHSHREACQLFVALN